MGSVSTHAQCPDCGLFGKQEYWYNSDSFYFSCPFCGCTRSKMIHYEVCKGPISQGVDIDGYVRTSHNGTGRIFFPPANKSETEYFKEQLRGPDGIIRTNANEYVTTEFDRGLLKFRVRNDLFRPLLLEDVLNDYDIKTDDIGNTYAVYKYDSSYPILSDSDMVVDEYTQKAYELIMKYDPPNLGREEEIVTKLSSFLQEIPDMHFLLPLPIAKEWIAWKENYDEYIKNHPATDRIYPWNTPPVSDFIDKYTARILIDIF